MITYHQEGSGDEVHLHFYSDTLEKVEKSGIQSQLRSSLRNLCVRINQLILLDQLHETKLCSPLLEQPSEEDTPQAETASKLPHTKHSIFLPGEFKCPLQYTMELPLHHHVPVAHAIARCSTALNPFYVTNRKNFFEYREVGGKIFYLKLAQKHDASKKQDVLTVEVHGVDLPGPEITEQLYQMLESKLAVFTLSIISYQLQRNPAMKLSPEDIQAVQGAPVPIKVVTFAVPALFSASRFLCYLKQNFCQFLAVLQVSEDNSLPFLKGEPLEVCKIVKKGIFAFNSFHFIGVRFGFCFQMLFGIPSVQ